MHSERNGHTVSLHRPQVLEKTHEEVVQHLLDRTVRAGPLYRLAVAALTVLFLLGVVGVVLRLQGGVADHTRWGYTAGLMAFLLATGLSAPIASIGPRLARSHWRRPLSRAAEMWAVVGLLWLLLLIPLLFVLPSAVGRSSIWFVGAVREGWPPGAPHAWLFLAGLFLVLTGLALLWVGAIPDFAAARDATPGRWRALYARLSLNFQGTNRQWRVLRMAQGVLGGFYFLFLVFVHFLIASDFALSLVPGWRDSIFPAWQALGGLQSAVALTILTMFVLRTVGGYRDYFFVDQFWGLAKLLLAISLLWAYFWWAEFLTYWYGRSPREHALLLLLMFGPYKPLFTTVLILNFLLPFLMLLSNPLRRSILGPTLVACAVLVGSFLDKMRIFGAAFSVPDPRGHALEAVPPAVLPDGVDVLILVGGVAGAVLLYLLATRLVPIISIWETREGLLLQRVKRYLRLELKVLAKPE